MTEMFRGKAVRITDVEAKIIRFELLDENRGEKFTLENPSHYLDHPPTDVEFKVGKRGCLYLDVDYLKANNIKISGLKHPPTLQRYEGREYFSKRVRLVRVNADFVLEEEPSHQDRTLHIDLDNKHDVLTNGDDLTPELRRHGGETGTLYLSRGYLADRDIKIRPTDESSMLWRAREAVERAIERGLIHRPDTSPSHQEAALTPNASWLRMIELAPVIEQVKLTLPPEKASQPHEVLQRIDELMIPLPDNARPEAQAQR